MKAIKLLCVLFFLGQLSAQEALNKQVKTDLLDAQQRLSSQREEVGKEKIDLAAKFNALREERDKKSRQVDLVRRSKEGKMNLLRELEGKEYGSALAVSELNQMIFQYGTRLSVKFLPGEAEDKRLDGLYSSSKDPNQLLAERFAVLEAGMERLESAIGGQIIEARASSDEAKLLSGKVAHFGPVNWFLSDDSSAAGQYVVSPSGEVASLIPRSEQAVAELLSGKETNMTIDITGGKATALASIKQGPLDLIKKGGAWIFPILGIALIALISAAIKFMQLVKLRHLGSEWTQQVAEHYLNGETAKAEELAAAPSHPIGQVLPECIRATSTSMEVAEEVLYEKMIGVKQGLRSWLPFVAITAATAPMLGLLGTVSGLIRTFSVITVEGTGEAQSISGGISEALITTLFGLAVAIPAFIIHALLSRKAKGIEQTTERIALRFMNYVRLGQK